MLTGRHPLRPQPARRAAPRSSCSPAKHLRLQGFTKKSSTSMRDTRRIAPPPKENTRVARTTAQKVTKKAAVLVARSGWKASRRSWRNVSRNQTRPHLRILRRTITLRETIRRAWRTTAARAATAAIAEDEDGADAGDGAAAATVARTGTVAGGICHLRSTLRRKVSAIRGAMTGEVVTAARLRLLPTAARMTFCCRANRSRSTAGASRSHLSSRLPTRNRKSGSQILSHQLHAPPSACRLDRVYPAVSRATFHIGFWRTTRLKRKPFRARERRNRMWWKQLRLRCPRPRMFRKKKATVKCATAPPG